MARQVDWLRAVVGLHVVCHTLRVHPLRHGKVSFTARKVNWLAAMAIRPLSALDREEADALFQVASHRGSSQRGAARSLECMHA